MSIVDNQHDELVTGFEGTFLRRLNFSWTIFFMGRGNRSGPLRGARQQEWTIFGTGQQVWTIFGRGNNSGPSLGRGNRSGQSLGRGKQEWTIFGTGQQQGTIFGTGQQEWTNTSFFLSFFSFSFLFCDGATKETCGNVVTGHHNYRPYVLYCAQCPTLFLWSTMDQPRRPERQEDR